MQYQIEALKPPTATGSNLALLLVIALSAVAAVAALAMRQPALALVAAMLVPLVIAAITWPDFPTLLVLAVLYSNAAVIAVKVHGVPFVIGASVPALLFLPLAHHVVLRRERLIVNNVLPLLALFVVVQTIGALLAKDPDLAMDTVITSVTEGLVLYLLVTNAVRTPEVLRRAVWVLVLAGAFVSGLSLLQRVTGTYHKNYGGFAQMGNAALSENLGRGELNRQAGPVGEKNYYAQMLLMLVPLGLFRFWGERSRWLRALAALATVLVGLGVACTFSRGGAVGFVLLLAVMSLMRYIKFSQLLAIGVGIALVLLAVPKYRERLLEMEQLSSAVEERSLGAVEGDRAVQGRLAEMLAAGLVFADHPLIGVGPGMFKYYYPEYSQLMGFRWHETPRYAHNLYLGIAAEHGVLGLIAFMGILYVALRDLARWRRYWLDARPDLAHLLTGFLLAVVAFMTTGLFLSFAYVRYFWLVMALAGSAVYVARMAAEQSQAAEPERKGDA